MKKFLLLLLTSFFLVSLAGAWPGSNASRVVLQGFWWEYKNSNYPNGWANYLTELAPRLRELGIESIWIPPSTKGGAGTWDNGYGVFDHYDLGDKYQRGTTKTKLGTKDEFLRMVAVMHANGIEVIQDLVLNHVDKAGPNGDDNYSKLNGGNDPNAVDDQRKNFRYVSYSTPVIDESKSDYLRRNGRWFKDWQNFNKSGSGSWGFNDYNYPLHAALFGVDISYSSSAINTNGPRSTASDYGLANIYDPDQSNDYMKQQAIQWGVWMKKQTGIDGVRLDASKHFEWDVTNAFLWNLQHGSDLYGSKNSWANGGDNFWAVSEYIPEGGQPSMESHIDGVEGRTGTFDFNLRDQVYNMVSGDGFFDISGVPGGQISSSYRNRTVNFVNNHDTFRPRLNNGNYAGWYDGVHEASEPDDYPQDPDKEEDCNELRKHIDPFGRLVPAAYALTAAVDGSIQVFFEDLFNIGGTSKRDSHKPTSLTDLPVRDNIKNIMWARKAMEWDKYTYKVRTDLSENPWFPHPGDNTNHTEDRTDLLVIEREGKAIIGVNDNGVSEKAVWINTGFNPKDQLKDYSINSNNQIFTVQNDKRVLVTVPKAVKDAQGNVTGGYVILAKTGFDNITFNPAPKPTTQEWEMADDLGDSHSSSLNQGGAIRPFQLFTKPGQTIFENISISRIKQPMQYVGKVFAKANTEVKVEVFAPGNTKTLFAQVPYQFRPGPNSNLFPVFYISQSKGTGTSAFQFSYTPNSDGWVSIGIGNSDWTTMGTTGNIKAFVKVTYTAPATVNTKLFAKTESDETKESDTETPSEFSLEPNFPNPFNPSTTLNFTLPSAMHAKIIVFNALGQEVSTVADQDFSSGRNSVTFEGKNLASGVYLYKVITPAGSKTGKMMLMK